MRREPPGWTGGKECSAGEGEGDCGGGDGDEGKSDLGVGGGEREVIGRIVGVVSMVAVVVVVVVAIVNCCRLWWFALKVGGFWLLLW
jgi:hypothetical protein